jgi:HTH-type transcriptional regulator / antitoxin HigA
MIIRTKLDLKNAFNTFDKLIAEMGDDASKQAEAKLLAEAIQAYEQKHVFFPMTTTLSQSEKQL